MRRPKILLAIGALALLPACRGPGDSDTVPSTLPGTYVYAGKGSVFKKAWQFSARLDLTADRRFTMTLDKAIDGSRDSTETTSGAYAIKGDEVELRVVGKRTGPEKDLHQLQMKGDSLIANVGWTGELFLKGIGAPNVVFVKQRS
ncbi:MAG: hypothetical protein ACJ8AK_02240 [Gemmatimonadaceae bacterium]